MTIGKTIVFVHGVGGPVDSDQWLGPLNVALSQNGYERIRADYDTVVEPKYLDQMRLRSTTQIPPVTWRKPEDRAYFAAKTRYAASCEQAAGTFRRSRPTGASPLSGLPDFLVQPLSNAAIALLMKDVRLYQKDAAAKASALVAVLRTLPKAGSIVLIGHSLGSVIAHDLLRRLPPGLTVDMLITLGSPLSISGFGDGELRDQFPYDRVHCWVNLYDPEDIVTCGRGAAGRFPDVIDFAVNCRTHDVAGYSSHPASAYAVGCAVFGAASSTGTDLVRRTSITRRLGTAWFPSLLQAAYCSSLSMTFTPDEWKAKQRLDAARRIVATRVLEQVQESLAGEAEVQQAVRDALANKPTVADFLDHALVHVTDRVPLADLISVLVTLASASPVAPFDVSFSGSHQRRALERFVLTARRRVEGEPLDSEVVKRILAAVDIGRQVVKPDSGSGGGWLLLVGLGILAATGIGLVAAIPAGLAGAAALTSTLAAFGPGGIIGGILTLTALTGAGSGLLGSGLTADSSSPRPERSLIIRTAADALAYEPVEALRATVAALLGVTEAQKQLHVSVSYSEVWALLNRTHDLVSGELELHRKLSPDRPGTKVWVSRSVILGRAIEWMRQHDWPEGTRRVEFPSAA